MKAYKHCSDLRATAQMAPGLKPEQYTVLVRDIPSPPPGQAQKDQAIKTWEELEGYKKKLERAELVFFESKSESRGKLQFDCKTWSGEN
ncbi:CSC1-like protein erd4 [Asimina triloba]